MTKLARVLSLATISTVVACAQLWGCASGGDTAETTGVGGGDTDASLDGSGGSAGSSGSAGSGGTAGFGGGAGFGGSAGGGPVDGGEDADLDGGDADADAGNCADNMEICNGLDDNCNGAIDEGDPGGGNACTIAGRAGICADGEEHCTAGVVTCVQLNQQSNEKCNGLDDDCDGTVDDGNPEGNTPCSTGLDGVCATGTTACEMGALVCNQDTPASTEVCNGLDDDCNGTPDDGFSGAGMDCTVPNQPANSPCAKGKTNCLGGQSGCTQTVFATPDTCDGIDNDCDGTIDNPADLNGQSCQTTNQGVCAAGKTQCSAGTLNCVPDVQPGSTAESCNALDDNCDGTVDNVANIDLECSSKNSGAQKVAAWQCSVGFCAVSQCVSNYGNCDFAPGNGCETNFLTDADNCGGCGNVCNATNGVPYCDLGSCKIACSSGFGDCDNNSANGCETNTQSSMTNCGGCGVTCTNAHGSTTCTTGACAPTCSPGFADCDGNKANGCETDLSSSVGNCGACGAACANANGTTSCSAGSCVPVCNSGFASCDSNASNGCETNTNTNVGNCGACGTSCVNANGTTSCVSGMCSPVCSNGSDNCDGNPNNGCETNINGSVNNCGACGNMCTNAHGSNSCSGGNCNPTCTQPWSSCDGNPNNGCETNLNTDVNNCAACGFGCSNPNGTTSCANGTCAPMCSGGFGDCDTSRANGCETQTSNDVNNCGACNTACTNANGTTSCNSGTCSPTCASGWRSCDSNANNGCETHTDVDVNNCGTCGNICVNPNGSVSCSGGACQIGCAAGFANCDGNTGNGCEQNINNNVNNCGGCNIMCTNAHGTTGCAGGSCQPVCSGGWASCDGNAQNGCETNITTSVANCGSCGVNCTNDHGSTSCGAGVCQPVCSAGWADCDGNPRNGCETNINTSAGNCGACGTTCTNANGSTQCTAGLCVPTCNAGFSSCDGNANNGCETNTNTSINNCGSCGTTCSNAHGTTSCSGGSCAPVCSSPWATCDGNSANGCETNTNTDVDHCGSCSTDCDSPLPSQTTGATCGSGSCQVSSCSSTYYNQNNNYSDGCECQSDNVANSCGSASDLGTVAINGTTTYTGNLTPSGDEDWFKITFTSTASCSYNPKITVSTSAPVRLQVFKNCSSATIACGANNSGAATGWNTWEFTYTAGCGDLQSIDPTPASGSFINTSQIPNPTILYVRVFPTGSSTSCLNYTLTATN